MTSLLCIFIDLCRSSSRRGVNFEMFQFRPAQKWYRCSPQRANCAKPRRALVADSVSKLMVRGREHSWTGSGQTMVRSRGGPISHPTGQPFGSWKYVETGTSPVGETHRLNSVEPTEFSLSFSPIFRNDPLGLLGRPG